MRILGVHDGHNSSACLLVDGQIRHAVQEERLTRVKNHYGFPVSAVREILDQTGLDISEIDYIAFSSYDLPAPGSREQVLRQLRQANSPWAKLKCLAGWGQRNGGHSYRHKRRRIMQARALGFPDQKIVFVEHHAAHAAAAYYGSSCGDEKVLVLTNDGGADGLCATVSLGCNGRIKRLVAIPATNSPGLIYAAVTALLGMQPNQDEPKMMELASYLSGKAAQKSYEAFRPILRFNKRNPTLFEHPAGLLGGGGVAACITDAVRSFRFDEVAAGLQMWAEEVLAAWVRNCIQRTGATKLALAGGVFKNAKVNKVVSELPEVEELFVFPSCGAETNAIGAAYWIYARHCLSNLSSIQIPPIDSVYWGRQYGEYEIEKSLLNRNRSGCVCVGCENIEGEIAHLLAQGEVVARFKGRMEFGDHGLGNRSILAEGSPRHVMQTVKEMVGNPDFWTPIPCSILKERERDYILNPKEISSPHMMMSYHSSARAMQIAAVIHPGDSTVRPQVVGRDLNPDFYYLLKKFEALTGQGAILNIPFLYRGGPIVASPDDALEVFQKSGLEYLALGNFLLSKKPIELRRPGEEAVEIQRKVRTSEKVC